MGIADLIPGVSQAKAIIGGAALVALIAFGCWVWRINHLRAEHLTALHAEQKAHSVDVASWRATVAQAQAEDAAHAAAVERQQSQISQEKERGLQDQLADARSIAARWMQQHAAPADNSGSGHDSTVPDSADPTANANRAAQAAIVSASDIDACVTSYVVAKGWQDWWKQVQPVWAAGAASQ